MKVQVIAKLTVREAQRRSLLWIALGLGILFIALYAIGFHHIHHHVSQHQLGAAEK